MTISAQQLKINSIAEKLYGRYCDVSDECNHHTWDYLDDEIKDNWRSIAIEAIDQLRNLAIFQTDAVVQGYRERGLFQVPHDWTFDNALCDFFHHGWTQAFDSFWDVPDEASNGHS